MKKFAALMIALILALSCFAVAEEESYTIGIAQFAEHGSLDNCREGFLAGLAEEGIVEGENLTVEYQNAQADTSMATTIASNFVANGYDLICAIATCLTRKLLVSVVIYMAYSVLMSIMWMLLQSPDLAITEAAVGAGVTSILFFIVLKKIHAIKPQKEDEPNDQK